MRTLFHDAPSNGTPELACDDVVLSVSQERDERNDYQQLLEWSVDDGIPPGASCVLTLNGGVLSNFRTADEMDNETPEWTGEVETEVIRDREVDTCGNWSTVVGLSPKGHRDDVTGKTELLFELQPEFGLPVWGVPSILAVIAGDKCIDMDDSLGQRIDRVYDITVADEAGNASEAVSLRVTSCGCAGVPGTAWLPALLAASAALGRRRPRRTSARAGDLMMAGLVGVVG